MTDDTYLDFETVRETLIDTQERRGFLTYEQKLALQHAEWAASDSRNGYKTDSKVFKDMVTEFLEIEKLAKYPELAAKLAEVMPVHPEDVRAVLASRRIAVDASEIELMIDIVRKHVGIE
ncbi:MAG: hypothetical protein QF707_00150 [Candidatus Poseidoniaceae archaeon]|jgi:DNA-directed RNA polymerase subunit F|nr:hypothetical protein [Candidatus Poseidoniaceae archaeon]MDP7202569.1 hypothetical protein [Candidatus Poseidoniaceae archaeon]|tara:strand:- start:777 stop:1136 length:360 start_codon:yes stop_codon:yes gene_type:complete